MFSLSRRGGLAKDQLADPVTEDEISARMG
jgi:hypothetical protein